MATVKVILRKSKKRANGEMPLYIRITKDRKSSFISLSKCIDENQWNEIKSKVKNHPNSTRLNNYINQKRIEVENRLLDIENNNELISVKGIKESIGSRKSENFIEYAENKLEELKTSDKIGTYKKEKGILSKLKKYLKSNELAFNDINYEFISKYEKHLGTKLNNKINTIHSNLKFIRKTYNSAIRENLVKPDKSPFFSYRLKRESSQRTYLTNEELERLENLKLDNNSILHHCRNTFVFACYAGGIRISDLLTMTWENFDGTHIKYYMRKTKDPIRVKLPNTALSILAQYQPKDKNSDSFYIFPFLNDKTYSSTSIFNRISSSTTVINLKLKKLAKLTQIDKKLTTHVARHTFATIALSRGIRIPYVSNILGHNSIKTTQIYTKIIGSDLDEAMALFNES